MTCSMMVMGRYDDGDDDNSDDDDDNDDHIYMYLLIHLFTGPYRGDGRYSYSWW